MDKHLFNSMNYRNEEIEALVPPTLDMPVDNPKYVANVQKLLAIMFEDVPFVPIYQPFLDVAMQKNVHGYRFYFHRQLDTRWMKKT